MGPMVPARTTRTGGICLATLGVVVLAACSSEHREPAIGELIFDETVTLERGELRDVARHEITVDRNATFVAIADEDDIGLDLRMSLVGVPETPASKVEVNSNLSGEGIEIATLDAPLGARLAVELESEQEFERPGKARLRILRFDGELAAGSHEAARLSAFRAWSAATSTNVASEDWLGRRFATSTSRWPISNQRTVIPCWPPGGEWPAAASTPASSSTSRLRSRMLALPCGASRSCAPREMPVVRACSKQPPC
jgi:hypothetical protein